MKKKATLTKYFSKIILIGTLINLTLILTGCSEQPEIKFPVNVGVKPESITKGFNNNYYVTLMNSSVIGDGEVAEISKNGVKIFAKGFDDPKGIVFINDHLYFSDVTRVWKVDKNGNARIFINKEEFPEEVLALNDVAIDGDKKGIYVTDMGATNLMRDENGKLWPLGSEQAKQIPQVGRIYHINLNGEVSIVQDSSPLMTNPNGVSIDNNNNLMVGAFFNGHFLITRNGELTPLKGQFRGADGIEQDSKGNYYISSWELGTVWKIDGITEESTILIDGLESAADFYLEEDKGRILLPDMHAGKIYAIPIEN